MMEKPREFLDHLAKGNIKDEDRGRKSILKAPKKINNLSKKRCIYSF
jgi:hypothetical protein